MDFLNWQNQMNQIIEIAIQEDITDPSGKIPTADHSAEACIPAGKQGAAKLLVKSNGILAGVKLAELICNKMNSHIKMEKFIEDGEAVTHGDIAFHLFGEDKKLLQAERLILNFMQRMSGIATNTARYVEAVKGTGVKVLDTRKTTPALRPFEKWAVQIGGGHNHRFGLFDMIMLKDNHIDYCGGVKEAILATKNYQEKNNLNLKVEVETRTLKDVETVMNTGFVDRIMLDNFSVNQVQEALQIIQKKYETEVSGGITLDTIKSYADCQPDFISVGALTHSSGSLDLSLKAIK